MDNSFFDYMQQLELMAFFSGYPLIYAVVSFATGDKSAKTSFWNKVPSLLSTSYALVGTLFLGLQLKNIYINYPAETIQLSVQHSWLVIWALLSLIFWIPAFRKKPVLSLLHSFVFFFFLLRDLFTQFTSSASDNSTVKNDMKIYTDSLILNVVTLGFVVLVCFIYTSYKKNRVS